MNGDVARSSEDDRDIPGRPDSPEVGGNECEGKSPGRDSGHRRALRSLLPVVPLRLVSGLVGWVARRPLPGPVQARVNHAFARRVSIDVSESEDPPEAYPTLSALFSRRLREGAREWNGRPGRFASPADGILQEFGPLAAGRALQAKGLPYSVADLLGDAAQAHHHRTGAFLTVYLSPRHYHRVHGPCSARLRAARRIRGQLLPVRPEIAARASRLYVGNERLAVFLETGGANLAVVAVGALNVGSIRADFDPAVDARARRGARERTLCYDPPLELNAGDPLMTFLLGSTVVVLVSPRDGSTPVFRKGLATGMELRAGEPVLELPLRGDPR